MPTATPPAVHPDLTNVRRLARLLDTAFRVPGTRFRFGLDAVIGLVPWVGDAVGIAVGSYILLTAARLGVPRPVIARMLLNIGTDALVGSVPLVGDVFDAAWKANARNAALLERAVAHPVAARRSSVWLFAGLVAAVVAIIGGIAAVAAWVVSRFL